MPRLVKRMLDGRVVGVAVGEIWLYLTAGALHYYAKRPGRASHRIWRLRGRSALDRILLAKVRT